MISDFEFEVLRKIHSTEKKTENLLLGPDDLTESLNRPAEDINEAMDTLVKKGYIIDAHFNVDDFLQTTGCTQQGLKLIKKQSMI